MEGAGHGFSSIQILALGKALFGDGARGRVKGHENDPDSPHLNGAQAEARVARRAAGGQGAHIPVKLHGRQQEGLREEVCV